MKYFMEFFDKNGKGLLGSDGLQYRDGRLKDVQKLKNEAKRSAAHKLKKASHFRLLKGYNIRTAEPESGLIPIN